MGDKNKKKGLKVLKDSLDHVAEPRVEEPSSGPARAVQQSDQADATLSNAFQEIRKVNLHLQSYIKKNDRSMAEVTEALNETTSAIQELLEDSTEMRAKWEMMEAKNRHSGGFAD